MIKEIEAVVDSGSKCDLVNDEFYLHDATVQNRLKEKQALVSPRRGTKYEPGSRVKKDGVKMV